MPNWKFEPPEKPSLADPFKLLKDLQERKPFPDIGSDVTKKTDEKYKKRALDEARFEAKKEVEKERLKKAKEAKESIAGKVTRGATAQDIASDILEKTLPTQSTDPINETLKRAKDLGLNQQVNEFGIQYAEQEKVNRGLQKIKEDVLDLMQRGGILETQAVNFVKKYEDLFTATGMEPAPTGEWIPVQERTYTPGIGYTLFQPSPIGELDYFDEQKNKGKHTYHEVLNAIAYGFATVIPNNSGGFDVYPVRDGVIGGLPLGTIPRDSETYTPYRYNNLELGKQYNIRNPTVFLYTGKTNEPQPFDRNEVLKQRAFQYPLTENSKLSSEEKAFLIFSGLTRFSILNIADALNGTYYHPPVPRGLPGSEREKQIEDIKFYTQLARGTIEGMAGGYALGIIGLPPTLIGAITGAGLTFFDQIPYVGKEKSTADLLRSMGISAVGGAYISKLTANNMMKALAGVRATGRVTKEFTAMALKNLGVLGAVSSVQTIAEEVTANLLKDGEPSQMPADVFFKNLTLNLGIQIATDILFGYHPLYKGKSMSPQETLRYFNTDKTFRETFLELTEAFTKDLQNKIKANISFYEHQAQKESTNKPSADTRKPMRWGEVMHIATPPADEAEAMISNIVSQQPSLDRYRLRKIQELTPNHLEFYLHIYDDDWARLVRNEDVGESIYRSQFQVIEDLGITDLSIYGQDVADDIVRLTRVEGEDARLVERLRSSEILQKLLDITFYPETERPIFDEPGGMDFFAIRGVVNLSSLREYLLGRIDISELYFRNSFEKVRASNIEKAKDHLLMMSAILDQAQRENRPLSGAECFLLDLSNRAALENLCMTEFIQNGKQYLTQAMRETFGGTQRISSRFPSDFDPRVSYLVIVEETSKVVKRFNELIKTAKVDEEALARVEKELRALEDTNNRLRTDTLKEFFEKLESGDIDKISEIIQDANRELLGVAAHRVTTEELLVSIPNRLSREYHSIIEHTTGGLDALIEHTNFIRQALESKNPELIVKRTIDLVHDMFKNEKLTFYEIKHEAIGEPMLNYLSELARVEKKLGDQTSFRDLKEFVFRIFGFTKAIGKLFNYSIISPERYDAERIQEILFGLAERIDSFLVSGNTEYSVFNINVDVLRDTFNQLRNILMSPRYSQSGDIPPNRVFELVDDLSTIFYNYYKDLYSQIKTLPSSLIVVKDKYHGSQPIFSTFDNIYQTIKDMATTMRTEGERNYSPRERALVNTYEALLDMYVNAVIHLPQIGTNLYHFFVGNKVGEYSVGFARPLGIAVKEPPRSTPELRIWDKQDVIKVFVHEATHWLHFLTNPFTSKVPDINVMESHTAKIPATRYFTEHQFEILDVLRDVQRGVTGAPLYSGVDPFETVAEALSNFGDISLDLPLYILLKYETSRDIDSVSGLILNALHREASSYPFVREYVNNLYNTYRDVEIPKTIAKQVTNLYINLLLDQNERIRNVINALSEISLVPGSHTLRTLFLSGLYKYSNLIKQGKLVAVSHYKTKMASAEIPAEKIIDFATSTQTMIEQASRRIGLSASQLRKTPLSELVHYSPEFKSPDTNYPQVFEEAINRFAKLTQRILPREVEEKLAEVKESFYEKGTSNITLLSHIHNSPYMKKVKAICKMLNLSEDATNDIISSEVMRLVVESKYDTFTNNEISLIQKGKDIFFNSEDFRDVDTQKMLRTTGGTWGWVLKRVIQAGVEARGVETKLTEEIDTYEHAFKKDIDYFHALNLYLDYILSEIRAVEGIDTAREMAEYYTSPEGIKQALIEMSRNPYFQKIIPGIKNIEKDQARIERIQKDYITYRRIYNYLNNTAVSAIAAREYGYRFDKTMDHYQTIKELEERATNIEREVRISLFEFLNQRFPDLKVDRQRIQSASIEDLVKDYHEYLNTDPEIYNLLIGYKRNIDNIRTQIKNLQKVVSLFDLNSFINHLPRGLVNGHRALQDYPLGISFREVRKNPSTGEWEYVNEYHAMRQIYRFKNKKEMKNFLDFETFLSDQYATEASKSGFKGEAVDLLNPIVVDPVKSIYEVNKIDYWGNPVFDEATGEPVRVKVRVRTADFGRFVNKLLPLYQLKSTLYRLANSDDIARFVKVEGERIRSAIDELESHFNDLSLFEGFFEDVFGALDPEAYKSLNELRTNISKLQESIGILSPPDQLAIEEGIRQLAEKLSLPKFPFQTRFNFGGAWLPKNKKQFDQYFEFLKKDYPKRISRDIEKAELGRIFLEEIDRRTFFGLVDDTLEGLSKLYQRTVEVPFLVDIGEKGKRVINFLDGMVKYASTVFMGLNLSAAIFSNFLTSVVETSGFGFPRSVFLKFKNSLFGAFKLALHDRIDKVITRLKAKPDTILNIFEERIDKLSNAFYFFGKPIKNPKNEKEILHNQMIEAKNKALGMLLLGHENLLSKDFAVIGDIWNKPVEFFLKPNVAVEYLARYGDIISAIDFYTKEHPFNPAIQTLEEYTGDIAAFASAVSKRVNGIFDPEFMSDTEYGVAKIPGVRGLTLLLKPYIHSLYNSFSAIRGLLAKGITPQVRQELLGLLKMGLVGFIFYGLRGVRFLSDIVYVLEGAIELLTEDKDVESVIRHSWLDKKMTQLRETLRKGGLKEDHINAIFNFIEEGMVGSKSFFDVLTGVDESIFRNTLTDIPFFNFFERVKAGLTIDDWKKFTSGEFSKDIYEILGILPGSKLFRNLYLAYYQNKDRVFYNSKGEIERTYTTPLDILRTAVLGQPRRLSWWGHEQAQRDYTSHMYGWGTGEDYIRAILNLGGWGVIPIQLPVYDIKGKKVTINDFVPYMLAPVANEIRDKAVIYFDENLEEQYYRGIERFEKWKEEHPEIVERLNNIRYELPTYAGKDISSVDDLFMNYYNQFFASYTTWRTFDDRKFEFFDDAIRYWGKVRKEGKQVEIGGKVFYEYDNVLYEKRVVDVMNEVADASNRAHSWLDVFSGDTPPDPNVEAIKREIRSSKKEVRDGINYYHYKGVVISEPFVDSFAEKEAKKRPPYATYQSSPWFRFNLVREMEQLDWQHPEIKYNSVVFNKRILDTYGSPPLSAIQGVVDERIDDIALDYAFFKISEHIRPRQGLYNTRGLLEKK